MLRKQQKSKSINQRITKIFTWQNQQEVLLKKPKKFHLVKEEQVQNQAKKAMDLKKRNQKNTEDKGDK